MRVQNQSVTGSHEEAMSLSNYASWLMKLGEGRLPNVDLYREDTIEIPADMCVSSLSQLLEHVYNGIENPTNHQNTDWMGSRCVLSTTNIIVDKLNNMVLDQMPGEAIVLKSVDSVAEPDQQTIYPPEFLNALNLSGMPPHEIRIKINSPIILLRNIDSANGHCNGTRYFVTRITPTVIEAKIIAGEYKNNILLIPRIIMSPSDNDLPFTLQRRQFPIRLSYCMTINKAQGQSFQKAGVYLPDPVFTHGQLYVAASRVGDGKNIKFKLEKDHEFTQITKNVVYREIIHDY